jgi:hypothetical protein
MRRVYPRRGSGLDVVMMGSGVDVVPAELPSEISFEAKVLAPDQATLRHSSLFTVHHCTHMNKRQADHKCSS